MLQISKPLITYHLLIQDISNLAFHFPASGCGPESIVPYQRLLAKIQGGRIQHGNWCAGHGQVLLDWSAETVWTSCHAVVVYLE